MSPFIAFLAGIVVASIIAYVLWLIWDYRVTQRLWSQSEALDRDMQALNQDLCAACQDVCR